MSLTIPFITWGAVVLLTVLIAVAHAVRYAHHNHIFGMGSEREEFFVPGDPMPENDEDYNGDEF